MSKALKTPKSTPKTKTTKSVPAPADDTLRLGLPKGSLEESTFNLFAKAGYSISGSARGYRPYVEGKPFEVRLIRPQEISRYVHQGFLDAGITGKDWIAENESDVQVVCDLNYNKATRLPARWVLAVPENSPFKTVKDLEGKRIATEPINLVKAYLKRHGVTAEVEFSWGATEVKVPELVDAIVDITETGSSIRANNLRIIDTVMESYPQFICSREAWKNKVKRKKIESVALMLNAALAARDKVGIKMNVPTRKLAKLLKALPALRRPTISPLSDKGWVAVETILDERVVRDIIPPLRELGAEGIIEYPLNKVVY
ncbi:ATP phosphoribosyltransferase [Verrucomicrobium sp. GAS474]|uniref:ATP phosphoribosyltransferase n=1 Tax=Verrucomicrobium sp. GAS474 TaxID=1882831 RepID=UPI00087DA608|nr:ATP phosphoribosyltransferase [Verrucomicrobium sp. GAS474]SDU16674.1 ATP phosphoribosyltransferase [Verrucomicrobium sp. GAS474]